MAMSATLSPATMPRPESDFAWFEIAFRRSICLRAIKVGVIVGTILMVINHGDTLLNGNITAGTAMKIALTYLVPYVVSTYASVCTARQPTDPGPRVQKPVS